MPEPHERSRTTLTAPRVDFDLSLVGDVCLKEIGGKHVSLEKELVVRLQRVEHISKRARYLLYLSCLLGRELIQVFVHRITGINSILDPIQTCHQQRRKAKKWVAGRVRCTEFDPLGTRALGVYRNATDGRTVALRVGQIDRRFETGYQTAIGIGSRRRQRQERR